MRIHGLAFLALILAACARIPTSQSPAASSVAAPGTQIAQTAHPLATNAALEKALHEKGHDIEVAPLMSGLGFVKRDANGWIGAADPRRDGAALTR